MLSPGFERAETTPEPLAPRWHTAALIGLIVTVAVTGTLLTRTGAPLAGPSGESRITSAYVPMLVVNAALVLYVSRVGRPRSALRFLLGRGWDSLSRACGDLAIAAAMGLLIEAVEVGLAMWRSSPAPTVLPHTVAERIIWGVVAAVVGISEEIVYRGYLRVQLTAFSGRASVGVLAQGALFGLAHCDQGPWVAIRFGLYGVMLGAVARWRRTLWPGIACHVGLDLVGGLVAGMVR